MSLHENQKPEARNVLEFTKDAASGVLKPKTLHTIPFRGAAKLSTIDIDVALAVGTAGFTPSGTAPLRLTYLNFSSSFERTDYSLADRNGTFDIIVVGTAISPAGAGVGARGQQVILRGHPENPIHVAEGTMNIYNTSGSQSAGTYIIAWEGVQ